MATSLCMLLEVLDLFCFFKGGMNELKAFLMRSGKMIFFP